MSKLSLVIPTVGLLNTVACPEVDTALSTIQTWANGEIEGTNNLKAEGVTEANLDAATKTLLNTKSFAALTYTSKNVAEVTAATGELIGMQKEGSEVKLPAATANRIVGVYCGAGITSITVKAPVANTIYGDFLSASGVTTITLTRLQHVILQADGASWLIIAGEPKREAKYVGKGFSQVEAEAGVEPSATRPAAVILTTTSEFPLDGTTTVGGVSMLIPGKQGTFYVNPGEKWKADVAVTAYTKLL